MEQYFLANNIEDASKQQAILLSVCGSRTYALLRDLLHPARPAESTYKKIVDELGKHFPPKLSKIVERFAGPDLTLKKAVDIALAIESASKNMVDIKSQSTPSKVNRPFAQGKNIKTPRGNPECAHRGDNHNSSSCKFRDAECYHCVKKGPLARVCRNKKKMIIKGASPGTQEHKQCTKSKSTHYVKDVAEEDDVYVESMYHIRGENKAEAYEVIMELVANHTS